MMFKKLVLVCLLSISSASLFAQPGDPGGDPDNPVPITGIEVLLAAGAALGIRSLMRSKK